MSDATRIHDRSDRVCLIGAGYVGIAVARELQRAGIPYDQIEARPDIGGNWRYGVYESTHMITSKWVSEFAEYPMPAHYPEFPSHREMLAYLIDFVQHFGLDRWIECGREVARCEPVDRDGTAGWEVELSGGEVRRYQAVVIANGHHWEPNRPTYPGEFTGRSLHSYDYKTRRDFGVEGARVLVVGAGNSACDIAVEASTWSGTADISMRGGYWFFPKTVFGVPTSNFAMVPLPTVVQRPVARLLVALTIGDFKRYGVPKPDHRVFAKDVTVNTTMLSALQHGRVHYRPAIARLDGSTVHFVDGTSSDYDTIVWATGYRTVFPFLDSRILQWENGYPVLVKTLLVPRFANIYIAGALTARVGAGPTLPKFGAVIAALIRLQPRVRTPLSDIVAVALAASSSPMMGGAGEVRLSAGLAGLAVGIAQAVLGRIDSSVPASSNTAIPVLRTPIHRREEISA